MKTLTYHVPGISCMHCIHTIKTELGDLAGVAKVDADLASKQVTVEFDTPASDDKIKQLLVEINYPAAA
jgi:copper ion binding protein